ncbi:LOW QUALITY PROTEIN: peptidyl-tRNA hydrolase [Geomicrobium sp. JCM 19039]|nr:LOW QUALITY PROTEIN: peptidyl-tRNA hydrolase [Geomicrobium sp. JCM 19039]
MKLIAGLGNPGLKYTKTRHNVGFMAVNDLAAAWNIKLKSHTAFRGEYNEINVNGEKVALLKPLTFMNRSGESIKAVMDFYKLSPEDLLVVYDDLDLPGGTVKFRKSGGHGGHNGIRSIIDHLGTKEFNRARMGISRPPEGVQVVNYVLSKFSKEEKSSIEEAKQIVVQASKTWSENDFDRVMNSHN